MKNRKTKSTPASALTSLDPSHPNYHSILLKRSRLEAHRRRRLENQGLLLARDRALLADGPKKSTRREGG